MPEEETSQSVGQEPEGIPPFQPPRQPPGNQNPPPPAADAGTGQNGGDAEQLREIKAGERILIGIGIATILVNLGIWHTYSSQLDQMRIATEAATRAADAASDSLELNQGNFDRMMLRTIDQTSAQIQSAKAAKDAVAQAQKSLQATVDNFHHEQRAWLSASTATGTPKEDPPYSIGYPIINTGHTPAKNVVVYFTGNWTAKGHEPKVFTFSGDPIPVAPIAPERDYRFSYSAPAGKHIDLTQHTNDMFYVYGAVTYDDVFGARHWLTYCFFNNDGENYAYCGDHNDMGDGPLPPTALK